MIFPENANIYERKFLSPVVQPLLQSGPPHLKFLYAVFVSRYELHVFRFLSKIKQDYFAIIRYY